MMKTDHGTSDRTVFTLPVARGLRRGMMVALVVPALASPAARLAGYEVPAALVVYGLTLAAGGVALALSVPRALLASSIQVDGKALSVRHGGRRAAWIRTIPLDQIVEVRVCPTNTRRVEARTAGGTTYSVTGNMHDREEAERLAADVASAVGRHRRVASRLG